MVTHCVSEAHPRPSGLAQGFPERVQAHSHIVMVVAGALGTEWPFLPQRPLDALLLRFCTALQFSPQKGLDQELSKVNPFTYKYAYV